jgi:hypothetical protein
MKFYAGTSAVLQGTVYNLATSVNLLYISFLKTCSYHSYVTPREINLLVHANYVCELCKHAD